MKILAYALMIAFPLLASMLAASPSLTEGVAQNGAPTGGTHTKPISTRTCHVMTAT